MEGNISVRTVDGTANVAGLSYPSIKFCSNLNLNESFTGAIKLKLNFTLWAKANTGGGLFRSINKGVSWTKIIDYQKRINSCTFNPNNPNELYVATETDGLLLSTNIKSATPTFSVVQSYPFRHPVRIFFNPYKPTEMWVSSFGAGMMVANVNGSSGTGMDKALTSDQYAIFPNPSSGKIFISGKGNKVSNISIEIYDISGRMVLSGSGDEFDISSLSTGVYILKIRSENVEVCRKLIRE